MTSQSACWLTVGDMLLGSVNVNRSARGGSSQLRPVRLAWPTMTAARPASAREAKSQQEGGTEERGAR